MNNTAKQTTHIFHFMNIPFNVDQLMSGGENINFGGGWMATLISQMLQKTDFSFSCASLGKTSKILLSRNNRLNSIIIPAIKGLNGCRQIVEEFQPDIIHIHGTEGPYGLLTAQNLVDIPTVISIQGLLGPCSQWCNFFGNSSLKDIIKMHRLFEIPILRGVFINFLKFKINAKRERKIIVGNHFFIGRTEWDRAYIKTLNPHASYFHGGELLRKPFWQKRWKLNKAVPHRIIFTNAGHPYKGTEILLGAVNILKDEFPDITLCIAGYVSKRSGYGLYLRKHIKESRAKVILLGQLTAEEMTREMLSAHLFVSPSLVDNSPNAICEAQLLGIPVIASYTGGVPSLIQNNKTGLFFPKGDVPLLAYKIRELFTNDERAIKIGDQAYEEARQRHKSTTVLKDIINIYDSILSSHAKNK